MGRTHVHGVERFALGVHPGPVDVNEAALDLNPGRPAEIEELLFIKIVAEAAGAVAAVFHLAAVGVEDAIDEVMARVAGGLDNQQLVEADAAMAVGPGADLGRRPGEGPVAAIQHHKVITQPVHFGKFHFLAPKALF